MFAKTLLTISALVLIFAVININAGKNSKGNGNGQEGSSSGPPPSGVIALMSLCSQYIFFKFFFAQIIQ
jgi:hypothetical protein